MDVTIMKTTWRGAIPTAFRTPRSRLRSRAFSSTLLRTPSAAAVQMISENSTNRPSKTARPPRSGSVGSANRPLEAPAVLMRSA